MRRLGYGWSAARLGLFGCVLFGVGDHPLKFALPGIDFISPLEWNTGYLCGVWPDDCA